MGRKERCTPLTKTAQHRLRAWLKEPRRRGVNAVFPNMRNGHPSTDGVQSLLEKYIAKARGGCASLRSKRPSQHVLRHRAAMELLQAGVACSVIALWLGHESIETTQTYLHSHIELKEAAFAKLKPHERERAKRFHPTGRLLEFLNAL